MPFLKSLNSRLIIIVVFCVMGSGIISAYYQSAQEVRVQQEKLSLELTHSSARYSNELSEELSERKRILESLRDLLGRQLSNANRVVVPANAPQHPSVFMPDAEQLKPETALWLSATESFWEMLIPSVSPMFESNFLISRDGVGRAYPQALVDKFSGEPHVTQQAIFQVAAPASNALGLSVASPSYTDQHNDEWPVSLVTPVMVDGEFWGVFGGGLDSDDFQARLSDIALLAKGAEVFVFDEDNAVVLWRVHSHGGELPQQAEELGSASQLHDEEIDRFVSKLAMGVFPVGEVFSINLHESAGLAVYRKLSVSGWGLVVFYPQEAVSATLEPLRNSVYASAFLLALVLSVVLYLALRFWVVVRVANLARITTRVAQGDWGLTVPDMGGDEIGVLGRGINNMLGKIRDLVAGLNENIKNLEAASLEARKLTGAVEHSSNAVVVISAAGVHEYGNKRFWEICGYSRDDVSGDNNLGLGALLLPESMAVEAVWADINQTLACSSEWRSEYKARGAAGREFWLMQSISVIRADNNDIQYYICAARDVSELKVQQQQMEQMAYYDQLTGLQNRVLFKMQLQKSIKACQRESNQIAVLYLDLDHFKRVNDTLGHAAGDSLLVEVSQRLKRCLRDEDSVARLGGDEFAVLLNRIGTPQYASIVATKIINVLGVPFKIRGHEVRCLASIGITLAPIDSCDIDVLMKNADLAMYQAKAKGRNSFQFYTAEMNQAVANRMQLEQEMRHALEHNEFELYYQPQVDLRSGKIVAAEALIRWNHPVRGMVSPLEFIPLAEETGFILDIGRWALRTACQQAKSIQKGLADPVRIAVNISSRQLKEPNFAEELQSVFSSAHVNPELIEIEVTESLLMDNIEAVSAVLRAVRSLRVDISIDDFGTGYSSLSYLKKLPVSTLKVDREFVRGLPDDAEDRAITSLIVTMAASLNHKVVVEGVETVEQLKFLAGIGCDYAQGFYYSRPIPADELMVLLFDWDADAALDWG